VYFYIVYNIVNNAIFVLPAPVGAHTNKLLSFLYALLKTSDCILFNVFNFGKVSYAHAGNSLIDTNCSFSSVLFTAGIKTSSYPFLLYVVDPLGT